MKYRVLLTDEGRQNVRIIIDWYTERSASAAEDWYSGFQNLLNSLEENPQRYPLAPESRRFPIELRHANYGSDRRTTHRINLRFEPMPWSYTPSATHHKETGVPTKEL
jgi:hypothetical protein